MHSSHKTGSHTILRSLLLTAAFWLLYQGATLSPAAAAPSPSSPRLVGTVEGGPFSGAVFDDGTGVQAFYRLHEQLPDGSQCIKVRSDHVVLKRSDGSIYELYISQNVHAAGSVFSPSTDTQLTHEIPASTSAPVQDRPLKRRRPRHAGEAE